MADSAERDVATTEPSTQLASVPVADAAVAPPETSEQLPAAEPKDATSAAPTGGDGSADGTQSATVESVTVVEELPLSVVEAEMQPVTGEEAPLAVVPPVAGVDVDESLSAKLEEGARPVAGGDTLATGTQSVIQEEGQQTVMAQGGDATESTAIAASESVEVATVVTAAGRTLG